ncbi:YheC/YheD family protein [Ancylobacter vacuolatus]|uniref:ATP-grasp domain-containing protein n=1 Tax=Ancylobacter vacuolatus TaxID=223389 RepID=A0ABU0DGH0_9HYPH|nr:YheC/YheD family protein [Ancylobacter vacuolatus]MDQ0347350.1 hypothetical protein [Ancylobacter vacuolatus]
MENTMPDAPTILLLGHEATLHESLSPIRIRALLGEAALRGVRVVLARSADCDVSTGRIRANEFVEGAWTSVEIGVPPLVVAAAPVTRPEHRVVENWLRETTKLLGFDGFDKHEMTALLAAYPHLVPHLIPEEVLVAERIEAQLAQWLEDGPIVVKRSDGALGTGIFFIVPQGGEVVVHKDSQSWSGTAAEAMARVVGAIRARMAYRTYLVQRFIDTRDAVGQPATVRPDMVRRPDEGWDIYRLTGRISIGSKLVSNRAKGSALVDAESFFAARGAIDPAGKVDEIQALARDIATTLCREPGLSACYEFGIDFAVDQDLHFWFLEANKRPLANGAEVERMGPVMTYWLSLIAD